MVEFLKYTLDNGLKVILHQDDSSPLVAINLLYNVGSKHESADKTGLTHLFEHLMFSGTKNIPNFDDVIQKAGGENNAFTNNDFTNFYNVLPKQNLEVGLWLEADRMAHLTIKKKPLNTQKKVVIEEFKETCLNEPYGDMWHHLGEMVYPNHPYNWPVIGKKIDHIESVTLSDAEEFFNTYYNPNNAILSICGDIDIELTKSYISKYFESIQNEIDIHQKQYPKILSSHSDKQRVICTSVPAKAIMQAYKMSARMDKDYYSTDLLSDILSEGRSSRLYQLLVKEKEIFSSIDAYITGTTDEGAFVIDGKIMNNKSHSEAKIALEEVLYDIKTTEISDNELSKIKHKAESNLVFSETSILSKAMSLGYYEYLGDIELMNTEINHYNNVTTSDLRLVANDIFSESNKSELWYDVK
jgi:zinc protease